MYETSLFESKIWNNLSQLIHIILKDSEYRNSTWENRRKLIECLHTFNIQESI